MPAGRVADGDARRGAHDVHHGLDQRARREVLARARLDVLGVLFQQPLVDLALDVHVQADPGLAVDQLQQAAQLGRVLDAVLRLAKDDRDQARALAQLGQDVAVVGLQVVAVAGQQAAPAHALGDDPLLAPARAPARRPS